MATDSVYYVPQSSKLPLAMAFSLAVLATGAANWIGGSSPMLFSAGILFLALTFYSWFSTVIRENMAGLNNDQVKRSYVWGISWFIFSEAMFFAVFFGSLFYVRMVSSSHLDASADLLWNGFEFSWPLFNTPDMVVSGDAAQFKGPEQIIDPWHLPLINTILLLTSSVTVHFAHTALKRNNRKGFNSWLAVTVVLALAFLFFQVEEYAEAYNELGLTLESGIYGTTFFLLTGFHGAHVILGTFMLSVQLMRGLKGHFSSDDAFGFEASSWYWHFVDVVWAGLFIFVYVLGS